MASVKIKCNHKQTIKNSSKRSIVAQIIHKREYIYISLNIEPIEPEYLISYENGLAEISPKAKNYVNRVFTNSFIKNEFERLQLKLLELQKDESINRLSRIELSDILNRRNTGISFYEFADVIIKEKIKANKANTARTTKSSIGSLKLFRSNLQFEDINYKFLKDFETFFYSKGKTTNGLAAIYRDLRAIYNRAIKEQLVSKDNHPFEYYSIKTETTTKRALTVEQLNKVIEYVPNGKTEQLAKDVFLFSFYLAGMNFKDITFLTKEHLVNDRLVYSRGKTKTKFTYPLSPEALTILERNKGLSDKYLFPVLLKHENDMQHFYNNRYGKISHYMKQIGTKLNLPIPLTSYVARHTFASIAKRKNIPTSVISELLGHKSVKTTEIYLDSFESAVLDDYLGQITNTKKESLI